MGVEERGGSRYLPVEQFTLYVKPCRTAKCARRRAGLKAFGAVASVKVKTPLTLEGMRKQPPTAASLRATALEPAGRRAAPAVAALEGANLVESDYTGAVSLRSPRRARSTTLKPTAR